jgi:hypothetical protein
MVAIPVPIRSTITSAGDAGLCEPFVSALNVSGASISVFDSDGNQSTICSSNRVAARGEALQFELGEGPHWEALQTNAPVLCPDLAAEGSSRWPIFGAAALEIGMGAVFAFPMKMGAVSVGVVDLYSAEPRQLDEEQILLASSMAGRAAAPAARFATHSANSAVAAEQELAPALRREVHQATGMVQAQLDVSATDAFARLRAYAYTSGRPLADIARDVVGRHLDFSTFTD